MVFGKRIIFQLLILLQLALTINIFILFPSHGQRHVFIKENFTERFPAKKINCIYQDPSGIIWLGTSAGLFSYQGINYQVLPESETKNISHISTLSEDVMLSGTEDGSLIKVNLKTGKTEIIQIDSIESRITGIITKDNSLFIATYGDGLWTNKDESWQRINSISDYSIFEIYDMALDKIGRILIGTDDGLCIIDDINNKCKFLTVENGLPDNIVTAVMPDSHGNIWLGFHQNGFCVLENDKVVKNINFNEWNNGTITAINTQLEGQVFIGTDKGTLMEFNLHTKKSEILLESSNSRLTIKDILVDREANIWIADHQNGLSKSNLYISFIELPSSIKSKNVQSIFMDANNRLWFATEKALWEYVQKEADNPEFIKHLDSDVYGSTFISLYGKDGAIWIGTFGVGIIYYHPKSGEIQSYNEKNGLANNNVLSISATNEKIWFATLGGVSEANIKNFRSEQPNKVAFKNYHEEDGLGTEYIYQVIIDSNKNPWFATDGKGLTVMKYGNFINYSEKDGLDSKVIYSITEDENKNIWIATPKNGIFKFDGTTFENFSINAGLKNKNISTLYVINNALIIIHKFGIDLFQNNQLRSFGAAESIGEINPDLNAVTNDQFGNLWIGHQNGIIKLNATLEQNYQPEILINKILVNLKPIEKSDNSILGYNENYLTFNYIGLWYSDPLKITYEYKLDGINRSWISSRDNFVTFSNLPAGSYTFSVRASANDNFEHTKIANYNFRIRAPYWETVWFYVILFLLIVFTVGLIIVLRDKALKKKAFVEKEKIQFQFETLKSQINPHFLFNSFNTLISIIEEEPKHATEYVEKLSDFFRSILHLRDKDVITLKEEIDLVMDYAFLQEKRFGQNFSLIINIPDQWLDTEIPPLTIQLLAENAIKHNIVSKNKPLNLRVFIDQNYIIVQNDIHLKRKREVSTNYGLESIIKRYQLLSDIPVEIVMNELVFVAKLPLINS